jgi:uncharacterized phiE125 gp8 family phage protein
MVQVYELVSQAASPVTLADMRLYLKIPTAMTADDALIQILIDAATEYGEKYTGRDFRVKSHKLLIDKFAARICLRRSPVNSITTVQYLVSSVLTTIASTVYYLKKGPQFSEILLQDGQAWPTDIDEREQAIEIEFATVAANCGNAIKTAIHKWVAFAYVNRGDCDCQDETTIGKQSGADFIYGQFRIARV